MYSSTLALLSKWWTLGKMPLETGRMCQCSKVPVGILGECTFLHIQKTAPYQVLDSFGLSRSELCLLYYCYV